MARQQGSVECNNRYITFVAKTANCTCTCFKYSSVLSRAYVQRVQDQSVCALFATDITQTWRLACPSPLPVGQHCAQSCCLQLSSRPPPGPSAEYHLMLDSNGGPVEGWSDTGMHRPHNHAAENSAVTSLLPLIASPFSHFSPSYCPCSLHCPAFPLVLLTPTATLPLPLPFRTSPPPLTAPLPPTAPPLFSTSSQFHATFSLCVCSNILGTQSVHQRWPMRPTGSP